MLYLINDRKCKRASVPVPVPAQCGRQLTSSAASAGRWRCATPPPAAAGAYSASPGAGSCCGGELSQLLNGAKLASVQPGDVGRCGEMRGDVSAVARNPTPHAAPPPTALLDGYMRFDHIRQSVAQINLNRLCVTRLPHSSPYPSILFTGWECNRVTLKPAPPLTLTAIRAAAAHIYSGFEEDGCMPPAASQ